jgi:hypothetical protein
MASAATASPAAADALAASADDDGAAAGAARAAASAWLESLLAASRPEATWTPHALAAALEWCAAPLARWRKHVRCANNSRCVQGAPCGGVGAR